MRAIFFLFIFMLLIASAHAEIKGEFIFSSEISSLKEGDLVEGVLKVWPLEHVDPAEFYKMRDMKIFNAFQLLQIQSVEPSKFNADVVEMKGTYLVHAPKNLTSLEFNYKGQVVLVAAPQVVIVPLENKAQDYFILDQSLSLSSHWPYLLGAVVVLLIILAKRKKLMGIINRFRLDPHAQAILFFANKFQNATTRKDYEEIYARREEWLPLLKEKPTGYDEFLNVMNLHQYKPAWVSDELREVRDSFDQIRGCFK